MTTKTTCDECGKEIEGKANYRFEMTVKSIERCQSAYPFQSIKVYDFCSVKCLEQFLKTNTSMLNDVREMGWKLGQ